MAANEQVVEQRVNKGLNKRLNEKKISRGKKNGMSSNPTSFAQKDRNSVAHSQVISRDSSVIT